MYADESIPFGSTTNVVNVSFKENVVSCTQNINPFSQFCSQLGSWSVSENIPLLSVTKLLNILRHTPSYVDFSVLPKDARSLVRTPTSIQTKVMACGKYFYFGIEKCINHLLDKFNIIMENNINIELAVNIDGLPLTKSTGAAFWPILGIVKSLPCLKSEVFVIAIFCGDQKPPANGLLVDFITESTHLTNNGLKCGV